MSEPCGPSLGEKSTSFLPRLKWATKDEEIMKSRIKK